MKTKKEYKKCEMSFRMPFETYANRIREKEIGTALDYILGKGKWDFRNTLLNRITQVGIVGLPLSTAVYLDGSHILTFDIDIQRGHFAVKRLYLDNGHEKEEKQI